MQGHVEIAITEEGATLTHWVTQTVDGMDLSETFVVLEVLRKGQKGL